MILFLQEKLDNQKLKKYNHSF